MISVEARGNISLFTVSSYSFSESTGEKRGKYHIEMKVSNPGFKPGASRIRSRSANHSNTFFTSFNLFVRALKVSTCLHGL